MSPRRRGRPYSVDSNHAEIVEALKACGVEVFDMAHVGDGMTDILARHKRTGDLLLIEIKRDESARRDLTEAQKKFHKAWPCHVVVDKYEALAVCGVEVIRGSR